MIKFLRKYTNQRGDTIVEVLVSVAILSIVLGTAYVTSSHSLRTGTDAGSRNQAVGYAQDQVERIKSLARGGGTVPTDPRFCFNPDGSVRSLSGAERCEITGTPYFVVVEYDSAPTRQVYTVTVRWESADGREDQMVLHYRAGV